MASGAKRQKYTLDEAVEMIFESEHGGMDSSEESELDRVLENRRIGVSYQWTFLRYSNTWSTWSRLRFRFFSLR